MPAPLLNKMSMNLTKNIKDLDLPASLKIRIMEARTRARIYSLDDSASGFLAKMVKTVTPEELLSFLKDLHSPSDFMWVELSRQEYANELSKHLYLSSEFMEQSRFVRDGFLYRKHNKEQGREQDSNIFEVFHYIHQKGKSSFLSPVSYVFNNRPLAPSWFEPFNRYNHLLPMHEPRGHSFGITYIATHKTFPEELYDYMATVPMTKVMTTDILVSTSAYARDAVFLLMMLLASKRRAENLYTGGIYSGTSKNLEIRESLDRETGKPVGELTLYLGTGSEPTREQTTVSDRASAKRHISAYEVGGHWCYQRGRENPYVCLDKSEHDWQTIERDSPNTLQACLACGQKRWFRKEHKRGNGPVVKKVHNVKGNNEVTAQDSKS
jgi:hypothetical protein